MCTEIVAMAIPHYLQARADSKHKKSKKENVRLSV